MRFQATVGVAGLIVVSLILSGCGENLSEVTGTVRLDGNPVEEGSIAFTPVDGKTGTGSGVIKAGKYTAKVPPGNMKVSFTYPKAIGKRKAYDTPESPEITDYQEEIPEKYRADKSELKYEVKSGSNKKDWDLSSK